MCQGLSRLLDGLLHTCLPSIPFPLSSSSNSPHVKFSPSTTMSPAAPKRIVLKCPERHWKTQNEMLKAFFDL
ncbi:uncharacterized protein SETTUDRAFT_163885 [Exserohilum turcica Et28A]|uniref:Uncharacterized protein n=1 Tax=Exserohilum turcicum (strain 28A) TaxID=671987 RepID=R0IK03_EXST2|nr:uncharacterized protein SETTUDRAFT_163885 [Exserohilum turcica Et28A]EOA85181.1 hypothetical protein SETTUDRAFT_163885 [Exserohilum turcica Et28A]